MNTLHPSGLTVLYDADCPVCRRARRWTERHRQLVPVRFVPAGSTLARTRFPDLDVGSTLADVTVVTHEGAVLRGDRAWITVLWAVARTRPYAIRLAHGRGTRRFRGVKGATEAIRRMSSGQRDPGIAAVGGDRSAWPPPRAAVGNRTCPSCRT
jgi:predicted DCC family thiol-disulfide oxidoreductase YuxK